MNLAQVFLGNLCNNQSKTTLVGLSQEGETLWHKTKKEILEETTLWLNALKHFGIKKGDRIAISLGKSSTLIAFHIAILASGATAVPLNPSLSAPELEKILAKALPNLAITSLNFFTQNSNLFELINCPCWVENLDFTDKPNIFPLRNILENFTSLASIEIADTNEEDIALIVFTSGTTGLPKGVGLTHKNLFTNLKALLVDTWECKENERFLHVLPSHHIHGLGLGIYGSLLVGNTMFLLEKFDPTITLKSLAKHQITLFMGVPTIYHRMLNIEGDFDFSAMRLFTSGSAPLSSETFQSFFNRFGFSILERYGLTETLFNVSNPLNGLRKVGSVGLPVKGVEVQLFDPERLLPIEKGAIGEIWIKGANVFPGYWQDKENTQAVFYNGWFRTGDLGKFDEDGYLFLVGRIKELIIVGGTNVTPGEIERVLEKSPYIAECAITSLPDLDLGEKIVSCIVAKPNTSTKELELALRDLCQKELAPYKRPKEYYFIDELPRNSMSKLERNKLKIIVKEISSKQ